MLMATPISLGTHYVGTSASSISLTGGVDIQAGDLVVITIGYYSNSIGLSSVTDGTNTYRKATSSNAAYSENWQNELWFCPNAKAVSNPTITASASAAWTYAYIGAARVAGNGTWNLDKTASNSAANAGNTSLSATVGLTYSGELVIGTIFVDAPGTFTPSSGFTQLFDLTNSGGSGGNLDLEYSNPSGSGSVTFDPTWTTGVQWSALCVASFTTNPVWALTSLGNTGARSAASLSFTIPAGGIPAGALVCVAYAEQNPNTGQNWSLVTISDSRSNTWTVKSKAGSDNLEYGVAAFSILTTPLQSGDTITITTANSGDIAYASAFWAEYAGYTITYDSASYASELATLASGPNFTGNPFSYPNELVVALFDSEGCTAGGSFSPDSSWDNTYWTCYTGGAGNNSYPVVGCQTRINPTTSALTYNPSMSLVGTRNTTTQMFGFFAVPSSFNRRRITYVRR